jgi:hypothetical protein
VSIVDDAALAYPCPYCRAGPGDWCVRRSVASRGRSTAGRLSEAPTGRAAWLHTDRTAGVWNAHRAGMADGAVEVLGTAEAVIRRGLTPGPGVEGLVDEIRRRTRWLTGR